MFMYVSADFLNHEIKYLARAPRICCFIQRQGAGETRNRRTVCKTFVVGLTDELLRLPRHTVNMLTAESFSFSF